MKISFTITLNKTQVGNIQSLLGDEKTTPREDCTNWLQSRLDGELDYLDHDLKLARAGKIIAKEKEHARPLHDNVAPAPHLQGLAGQEETPGSVDPGA